MEELMKRIDSEQCILMALTKDGKCNLTINCDEALPAALLELIQTNSEAKRTLTEIGFLIGLVLQTDANDKRQDVN